MYSPCCDGHVEAVSGGDGAHAPKAAILFDKFHVMRHLGEALDTVRKSEYARLRAATDAISKARNTLCSRGGRTSRSTARKH